MDGAEDGAVVDLRDALQQGDQRARAEAVEARGWFIKEDKHGVSDQFNTDGSSLDLTLRYCLNFSTANELISYT